MKRKILMTIVWCAAALTCGMLYAANITVNGDFAELNKNGFPSQWTQTKKGGARAEKIAGADGKEIPVMKFDLNGEVTRIDQLHLLEPGRKYRVKFSAKSENLSGASVYLTTLRWTGGGSASIKGTTAWQDYDFVTSFAGPDKHCRLILFAGKGASGKVYFKNISVEEIVESNSPRAFLSIAKFNQPPVIDGKLDDSAWAQALAATPFVKLGSFQFTQFATEKTVVRLGYDAKNLYVGFHCLQQCLDPVRNTLDHFKAAQKNPDSNLFNDDCVMFFIQSPAANAPVYEFIANALGTLTDAECTPPDIWSNRNVAFSSDAKVASHIGNGFYSVEIAVPLAKLGLTGQDREHCKLLLGRLNQVSRERSVYYPAKDGFHRTAALGDAEFNASTPGVEAFDIGELRPGRNVASAKFTASAEMIITTSGEQKNVLTAKASTVRPDSVKLDYDFPGLEYNYLQFTVAGAGRMAWRSPEYIVDSAVKTIELNTAGAPNSPKLIFQKNGKGNYRASATPGLYPVSGFTPPFALGEAGNSGLIPFKTAVSDMLAIDFTSFWPEDDNTFHIAENSIQPIHIILSTPFKELKDTRYTINLVLPAGFSLAGATATTASGYKATIGEVATLKLGDCDYKIIPVTLAQPLPVKVAPSEEDALTLLLELPASGNKFTTRKADIYYFATFSAADKNIVEVPGKLDVTIYPALTGNTPKQFQIEMWGGRMVNLRDKTLMDAFIRKTVQGAGFNQIQNLRMDGMRRMAVLSFKRTWGEAAKKYIQEHPESRRIDRNGKPISIEEYNILCPLSIMNDKVNAVIEDRIKQGYKDYDIINYDYESPAENGTLSCYCQRCREAFSKFAGLDRIPEADEIIGSHKKQWIDFMTGQLADTCRFFQDIAHRSDKKLSFYSGYQSEKTLTHYTVDWKKLAGKIDMGSAGYQAPAATIRATIDALNGTPLLSGVITSPWHLNSRQKNEQIQLSEILVGIVAGSKGILCYNLPGLNGLSYHSLSQATSLLSDYENILFKGRRHQENVKVNGILGDAWVIFELNGNPEKVLIAYNNTSKTANLTVAFDSPVNGYEYFHGEKVTGKTIKSPIAPFDAVAYIIKSLSDNK